MISEVYETINDEKKLELSNGAKVYNCSTPNCVGFSYTANVGCTVCGKPIRKVFEFNKALCKDMRIEQVGAKRRIVDQSNANETKSTFIYQMVLMSLGKMAVFDARKKVCTISEDSIHFAANVDGIHVPLVINSDEVYDILFCESVQVIFVRPKPTRMHQINELLKVSPAIHNKEDEKKWVVIVLEDIPRSQNSNDLLRTPAYLTVQQIELFCSNVRLTNGHCMLELENAVAKKLLTANGVRLQRNQQTNSSVVCSPNNSSLLSDKDSTTKPPACATASFTLLSPENIRNLDTVQSQVFTPKLEFIQNTSKPRPTPTNPGDSTNEDLVILDDDVSSDSHSETETEPESAISKDHFIYRPPGSNDGILLTNNDVACLSPGIFLNDTIINFYLKYLLFEQLSAFQRNATHIFNSFFYSRLSGIPNSQAGLPIGTHEQAIAEHLRLARHATVAKWTRRVDIFSKDYIIIPINESSHWFLGLVCYPWMVGMVSYTKLYEAFGYDLCQLTPNFVNVDNISVGSADIGQEELNILPTDVKGDAFDRWRRRRLAWLRRRGINAMPCILLFDSIPAHSRVGNLQVIRNYLQAEWEVRRSDRDGPLHFNKDTVRGFSPRVPSQSNLVDCGIFLLHYVEMFFKKPVKSYTKDYFQNEMASWFDSETLGQKRSVINRLIEQLFVRTIQSSKRTAS